MADEPPKNHNISPSPRPSLESDEETAAGSDFSGEHGLLTKPGIHTRPTMISQASAFTPGNFSWTLPISCASKVLRLFMLVLLPSLFRVGFSSSPTPSKTGLSKRGGAGLDGLRGLACLFVFNEHFSYNYSHNFLYGYGAEDRRSIVQWPFIRVFWSGFSMVAIFFVVSGYVLSSKPLKQIRARQSGQVHQTLSSSAFRRAIRLYLPSMIAVLITGFLSWAGMFNYATTVFRSEGTYAFELHEPTPPRYDGLCNQMLDAVKNVWAMTFPWRWDSTTSPGDYDLHLWTIPTEFRCSMVLFLTIIATSRLEYRYRIGYVLSFMVYCIYTERRDVLLFLSGMILAEVDLIRETAANLLPANVDSMSGDKPQSFCRKLLLPTTFGISLYLLSTPVEQAEEDPGFRTICYFLHNTLAIPTTGDFLAHNGSILQCAGAIMMTWCAANCASTSHIGKIFNNRTSQYLGAISYSLYLVHGNLLKSLLYPMLPIIARWTNAFGEVTHNGTERVLVGGTIQGFIVAWLAGLAIVLPITIWLADLFWRAIDIPTVRFAKWVEGVMGDDWDEQDVGMKVG